MSNFAGAKKIEWNAAGVAFPGTELGRIKNDSTHNPDTKTEEDSMGLEIFAGEEDVYEIKVFDSSKYAALRTKSISEDNKVDLKITYLDDTEETIQGFSVIVSKPTGFSVGTRNFFTARFKRFVIA